MDDEVKLRAALEGRVLGDSHKHFPRNARSRCRSLLHELAWLPGPLRSELARPDEVQQSLWGFVLLPGFSIGFLAAVLGRSRSSIRSYLAEAKGKADQDADLRSLVAMSAAAISAEDGLSMALGRGRAQLPYWSRLAIRELHRNGCSREDLAQAFRCSSGTIANVLQGKNGAFQPIVGARVLSSSQVAPPNQFKNRSVPRLTRLTSPA